MLTGFLHPDTYRKIRGSANNTKLALDAEGLRFAPSTVQIAAHQFQRAFKYLTGTEARRRTILQNQKGPQLKALRALLADGLDTWEKVEELMRQQSRQQKIEPVVGPAANIPPANPDEFPELVDFKNASNSIINLIFELKRSDEESKKRAEALQEELDQVSKQLERTREELNRARISRMLELAEQLGEKDVVSLVQAKHPAKNHLEETIQEELASFPKRATFGRNVPVTPRPSFLQDFRALPEHERKQVIKALVLLCNQGFRHPSLQTKRMKWGAHRETPEGASISRASSELRMTWMLIPEQRLDLYNVFRRGDIGWSEA